MKFDRKLISVLAIVSVLMILAYMYQRRSTPLTPIEFKSTELEKPKSKDFVLINEEEYTPAPSTEHITSAYGLQSGITEDSMYGYNYQKPAELPSVESLMPEADACNSFYDAEAAQSVPYVFTYPLTGTILKSRAEQAGDMWRGDLHIAPRDSSCDFKSIYNHGDQLLHGAFSDYTEEAHSLVGEGCTKDNVWTQNRPIRVQNEELLM